MFPRSLLSVEDPYGQPPCPDHSPARRGGHEVHFTEFGGLALALVRGATSRDIALENTDIHHLPAGQAGVPTTALSS
jgi:hypothetical protein